jgi:hypothetical protein
LPVACRLGVGTDHRSGQSVPHDQKDHVDVVVLELLHGVRHEWQASMATEQQRQKRRRHGLANYRLVRYADDFVVLVTGEKEHAHALRAGCWTWLRAAPSRPSRPG